MLHQKYSQSNKKLYPTVLKVCDVFNGLCSIDEEHNGCPVLIVLKINRCAKRQIIYFFDTGNLQVVNVWLKMCNV